MRLKKPSSLVYATALISLAVAVSVPACSVDDRATSPASNDADGGEVDGAVSILEDAAGVETEAEDSAAETEAEDPWAALDGRANAPTGMPQYPNLLNGYAARPPWQVAGVDYRVGVNTSVSLKNPRNDTLPAGVSRNTNANRLTVTGNDVTLDGWDFTEDGGWTVQVEGANCTIMNCPFGPNNTSGPNGAKIYATNTSNNLVVRHCVIDGGGEVGFLIDYQSGSNMTIEYTWLKNVAADLVGRHGQGGGAMTFRYNLCEQAGMGGPETHGDYLQIFGPDIDKVVLEFTTSVQVGGITQGWIIDNTAEIEINHNVTIGASSYWFSWHPEYVETLNFTHNHSDPRGFGLIYPQSIRPGGINPPGVSFANNVDMVSGSLDWND